MGDPCHGHAADGFAPLFAGEGELQQAREGDGVLEETLKEVAEAIQQHPLGVGGLDFHVVAQHRGELALIHLAVVGPGGLVFVVVVCVVCLCVGCLVGDRGHLRRLTLAGTAGGIIAEGGVAEITAGIDWLVCFSSSYGWWFWIAEQAALQGQFRLGFSGSRHGSDSGAQIVGASAAANQLRVLQFLKL